MTRTFVGTLAVALAMMLPSAASFVRAQTSTLLFEEAFEDTSFAARGWYDVTGATLSTAERFAGASSYECRFLPTATTCQGGSPRRHLFAETESLYVAYYVKHSTNWVGSGRNYHPHMFVMMTNLDSIWNGGAYTHLTTYIEQVGGVPHLALQDGSNIDESRVGVDLTNVTEQRSVAGCNGDSDGYGNGDCYPAGSVHWNGKVWTPGGQVYFDSTPGSSQYKGDWHLVEAYFSLNSVTNGVGLRDGVLRYWYDGNLIIDHQDVVLRTGANPTMKFRQFFMSPYIGDGSPVDQRYWIDGLLVATARPVTPPSPPGGSATLLSAPTNLRIVP